MPGEGTHFTRRMGSISLRLKLFTFCTEKGTHFAQRRLHVLHGEGGLFYTEKGTHFTRRSGLILDGKGYTFCTKKGTYLMRSRAHI